MEEQMEINQKEHALEVLSQLNRFRKEEKQCDFIIKCGSEVIPVHRNVISACSDYFDAMLTHDTDEKKSGVVKIKDVEPFCVVKSVDFMYTGVANIAKDDREPMMHVAHMLLLPRLCNGISNSLEKSLDSESFFTAKRIADTYSCKKLRETCKNFAMDNFRSISLEADFRHLEKEYVAMLIKSEDTMASESAKCKALIIWASTDLEGRGKFFEEMLSCLNLLKIPLGYRRYLIEKEPLVFLSNPCLKALLISIMDKANVLAKDFTIKDDGINNAITMFDKASKTVQVFEPEQKRWTRKQNVPDELNSKQFTAVMMGEFIYVLMSDKTGHRLSYADTAATWTRIPDRTATSKVSAVVQDGAIYAFDDVDQDSRAVERLDPTDGTWEHVTDREQPCFEFAVLSAQGFLYCVGGQSASSTTMKDFCSFDPVSSSWSNLPPMPTGRRSLAAVELNGKVYAIGGYTNTYVRTVEAFDCESETWTTVSSMNNPRFQFKACVLGEKIHVVGGSNSGNTLEEFDPYENIWHVTETISGKDIHPQAAVAIHVFT